VIPLQLNPIRAIQEWATRRHHHAVLRSITTESSGSYVTAAPILSGALVTPETAIGLAAVYAAINVISRDLASLPRNVYKRRSDGGREIAEDHPAQGLMRWSPNDDMDAFRWMQCQMGHVLARGNGFSEIVRDSDGYPVSLVPLHPAKTKPKRLENGQLYYELDNSKKLMAENCLHFAGLGFDGLNGYSPLTIARQTIGLSIAAEQYGAAFFGNSAVPKGMLKTPKKLSELAVNNLRRTFGLVHQGSQNAHSMAILEEGMDWVGTSISPEDGQFLQTRQFQVKDIARIYNLPPNKIGDYSESHRANVENANLDYATTTLYGWVVMIEYQLNLKLLSAWDRRKYEIALDMTALMRGDTAARTAHYVAMRNMGCMSANDILKNEGRNPLPKDAGGDLYIVQGQYVPLNMVGQVASVQAGATDSAPAAVGSKIDG
jgi:HK97 family phage portal protein